MTPFSRTKRVKLSRMRGATYSGRGTISGLLYKNPFPYFQTLMVRTPCRHIQAPLFPGWYISYTNLLDLRLQLVVTHSFPVILLVTSIWGLFAAGRSLTVQFALEQAREESLHISSSEASFDSLLSAIKPSKLQALATWDRVRRLNPTLAEAYFASGRLHLSQAFEATADSQLELLCLARREFQLALQSSPSVARFVIGLADAELPLLNAPLACGGSRIERREIIRALMRAGELAPWSTLDMYFGALVYLRIGERLSALRLLRLNQEVNPYFSNDQRQFTYALVRSKEELSIALPRKYPEILGWVEHFSTKRRREYELWADTFRAGLENAVDELLARHVSGSLSEETLVKYLQDMSEVHSVALDDGLRSRLDKLLAAASEPAWGKVLEARSRLVRIPVAKGIIMNDKFVQRGMLSGWAPDEDQRRVSLDILGRSIGIFLPSGYRAEMVLLQGRGIGAEIQGLQLFASTDNQNFFPVTLPPIQRFRVGGTLVAIFQLPDVSAKALKLCYKGDFYRGRFENEMTNLVQVFGSRL